MAHAKSELKSADQEFVRAKEGFESRVKIDIFSPDLSLLKDLLSRIRDAADKKYATCEALVRTLDHEFSAFSAEELPAKYLKELVELMNEINSSAEVIIEINGTFDGSALGDLAYSKYKASIEAQTIEKMWEAKYKLTPEYIEEDRKKKAEEEARKQREEALKQKEMEEWRAKREAEEKIKREERKKKQEAISAAKAHKQEVCSQCRKKTDDYDRALTAELPARLAKMKKKIAATIKELQKEAEELESRKASLGAFKFSEKKAIKKQLEDIRIKLEQYSAPEKLPQEEEQMRSRVKKAAEDYRSAVENYLARRFDFDAEIQNLSKQDVNIVLKYQMLSFLKKEETKKEETKKEEDLDLDNTLLYSFLLPTCLNIILYKYILLLY